ncbi:hypothetical protein [Martelella alba]|nr:hypothetical protein [Martelella alba]
MRDHSDLADDVMDSGRLGDLAVLAAAILAATLTVATACISLISLFP